MSFPVSSIEPVVQTNKAVSLKADFNSLTPLGGKDSKITKVNFLTREEFVKESLLKYLSKPTVTCLNRCQSCRFWSEDISTIDVNAAVVLRVKTESFNNVTLPGHAQPRNPGHKDVLIDDYIVVHRDCAFSVRRGIPAMVWLYNSVAEKRVNHCMYHLVQYKGSRVELRRNFGYKMPVSNGGGVKYMDPKEFPYMEIEYDR